MTGATFMQAAIVQAQLAEQHDEVPIGAVLVHQDTIIASAYNQPIGLNDPTAHAEMLVLRQAAKQLNNYRLLKTTLYVTLEPCAMCAAALAHARVADVVFGATDTKTGALGGAFDLFKTHHFNHRYQVTAGVEQAVCSQLLKDFFAQRR